MDKGIYYLYTMQFNSAVKNNQICRKIGRTGGCHVKKISYSKITVFCHMQNLGVCMGEWVCMYVCMNEISLGLGVYWVG